VYFHSEVISHAINKPVSLCYDSKAEMLFRQLYRLVRTPRS
jgi:hypothetical protein